MIIKLLFFTSVFVVFIGTAFAKPPNILLAISDDQSWPHAGAYGDATVSTPAFDSVAENGVLFTHAFCPASQCSPSRAALLTGRNIWQLEEAGTHASTFPKKFKVYTDILEEHGYYVGYTGKPWAPGSWKDGGRDRNPCGLEFNERKLTPPSKFISSTDYAANFREFLSQ
ncbi:MAG: sulfatase-like hydrolase/transferase, partial [Verrucomicrobiae bacterium]|nr:sulfatase-like hydrolase/transferase [Verrucomicrobiae bacterium]